MLRWFLEPKLWVLWGWTRGVLSMAFTGKYCLWILPLLNLLVSPLWADEIPLADCEALVAKYGKLEVASVAHRSHDGIITVEVNGHLIEKMGIQDS